MKKTLNIIPITLMMLLSASNIWGLYYWDYYPTNSKDNGFIALARLYLENGDIVEGEFIFDSSHLWVKDEDVDVAFQIDLEEVAWFEREGRRKMTIFTEWGEEISGEYTASLKSGYSLFIYRIPEERETAKLLKQLGLEMFIVNLDRKNNHPTGVEYIKRVEILSSVQEPYDFEVDEPGTGEFKVK